MQENISAACVSPSLNLMVDADTKLTFNFQPDGQVVMVGLQRENTVVTALNSKQASDLRDALNLFFEKRGGR